MKLKPILLSIRRLVGWERDIGAFISFLSYSLFVLTLALAAALSPFPLQNKSESNIVDSIALVNMLAAITVPLSNPSIGILCPHCT